MICQTISCIFLDSQKASLKYSYYFETKDCAMEDETLKEWKQLAAHNFIPKALIVGALGNLINFVILSR